MLFFLVFLFMVLLFGVFLRELVQWFFIAAFHRCGFQFFYRMIRMTSEILECLSRSKDISQGPLPGQLVPFPRKYPTQIIVFCVGPKQLLMILWPSAVGFSTYILYYISSLSPESCSKPSSSYLVKGWN